MLRCYQHAARPLWPPGSHDRYVRSGPGPAATPQGTSATTAIADPPHDRPTGDALQFPNHGLYCNTGRAWGLVRDTTRAVHTTTRAVPTTTRVDASSAHIRHRRRHAALNVNGHRRTRSSPSSVVVGALWVLMHLIHAQPPIHSRLFTAASSQHASSSSVVIGCDDRRARRVLVSVLVSVLVLVLAHRLAQYLAP